MFGDLDNAQTDAAAAAQRTFLASQAPYIPTIITLSCDTIVTSTQTVMVPSSTSGRSRLPPVQSSGPVPGISVR